MGTTASSVTTSVVSARVLVEVLKELPPEQRKDVIDEIGEAICLLCGNDAPCACAPEYDE